MRFGKKMIMLLVVVAIMGLALGGCAGLAAKGTTLSDLQVKAANAKTLLAAAKTPAGLAPATARSYLTGDGLWLVTAAQAATTNLASYWFGSATIWCTPVLDADLQADAQDATAFAARATECTDTIAVGYALCEAQEIVNLNNQRQGIASVVSTTGSASP